MAIALGSNAKGNISSASSGTTGAVTTQASGSTFYIAVFDANANLTVSDSKGNTYTQVGTDQTAGTGIAQLWRCENGTGGTNHTFTVTFGAGTGDCAFYGGEITGAATASFDQTAQALDGSSPFTVTTPTLSQADELILCLVGTDITATWAESTGFTIIDKEENTGLYWASAIAYKIVAATTAVTPSWTHGGAGDTALVVGTFKQASGGGGGGGTVRALLLLGVG